MRKWTQQDINQIKNLLVALNRAEYKVQGQELLAFGQAVRWLSMLHNEVDSYLKPESPSKTEMIVKSTMAEEKPQKKSKKKK